MCTPDPSANICQVWKGFRQDLLGRVQHSKTSGMKRLPNVISALRIAGSFGLLFCDVAGWLFWALYALCGISDMVDGPLARNLQAESKTGAVLDSVADIVFVACCAIRLLPVLEIPVWLCIWAGVIVFIKMVNQVSALAVFKRFRFPSLLLWLRLPPCRKGIIWKVLRARYYCR